MRIHRIRLRNYRGVTDSEVVFPVEGVTIIEGDNEVGKTSISEAISLLLEDRDDSTKKSVKAVKPVGKDVGAEVEMEMSSGPYRFRYRKRWHRKRETVLEILEPDRTQLTGREAHDRVTSILDETMDKPLWEALRLRQGEELEQALFAGGSLGRALDIAAGGESTGDREDDLWVRIVAERDRYWTPTGQPKAARSDLASSVSESARSVAELEDALSSLEDDAVMVERLVGEAATLADKQKQNDDDLERLTGTVDAITARRNEIGRLEAARDAARAHRERAMDASSTRADLVERAERAREQVERFASVLESTLPSRSQASALKSEVEAQVDQARDRLREAGAAHRQAVADSVFRRQQIELAQLSERQDRVQEAIGRRSKADAELETIKIDDDLLDLIDSAHLDLARAQAATTSAAVTVDAEAHVDLELQIDGDRVGLTAGEHREVQVTGAASIVLPGTLTMVVRAGSEVQKLADRQTQAEREFRSLCEEARVQDLAEARTVLAARHEAERVLAEVERSIAQDLRDLTPETLERKVDELTARVSEYEEARADEPPIAADLDSAQSRADELAQDLEGQRGELERLEKDLESASSALQAVDMDGAESKARLDQAKMNLAQADESLQVARAELSDDDVSRQVSTTTDAMRARTAELAAAEDALAAEDPESAEELLLNAREVKRRLADEIHDNEMKVRDLRTKLAVKGDEGLANKLDVAKSEHLQLASRLERLEARAAAAKMLHDTVAERRADAHQRYVAPFRERIEQLGRIVFGPDLEVTLGDDLRIEQRTLDGVTLDFDDLSTGAQEQLGLISRLACASIVSTDDGGAPVIFDDALGWSDPHRLERMGAAISMAGRTCQIIVLTCTPGRYGSVGSAEIVRLHG